jgi:hypothetical protein
MLSVSLGFAYLVGFTNEKLIGVFLGLKRKSTQIKSAFDICKNDEYKKA